MGISDSDEPSGQEIRETLHTLQTLLLKLNSCERDELIRVIKGRFPDLRSLAISPDGRFIATGYNEGDSRIDLWSVRTGKLTSNLGEGSDYVHSLSFSHNGRMIVSGHMSDNIKLWNAKTGKLIREFKQPFSQADQVAYSPDGRYIVSGGENQNILLWDVRTGKLIWSAILISFGQMSLKLP